MSGIATNIGSGMSCNCVGTLHGAESNKDEVRISQNAHDHFLISVVGHGDAEREKIRLSTQHMWQHVRDVLHSAQYQNCHRLNEGQQYTFAMVPSALFAKPTNAQVRDIVSDIFRYKEPAAEALTHLLCVPNMPSLMRQWGVDWIAGLHHPIVDKCGDPLVLYIGLHGTHLQLQAAWSYPHMLWHGCGLFLFCID